MLDDLCLLVPEGLINEISATVNGNDLFQKVKVISIPCEDVINQRCEQLNCETIFQSMDVSECFHEGMLLCDPWVPEIVKSPSCKGTLYVHEVDNLYSLMLSDKDITNYLEDKSYIISSGWLDKLVAFLENSDKDRYQIIEQFKVSYSKIIYIETGLYENSSENIEKLSKFVDIPIEMVQVDIDDIKMKVGNILLGHDSNSKGRRLKEVNEKVALYSLSMEVIRELVDLADEGEVARKITQMHYMIIAPENVKYISLKGNEIQPEYSTSPNPQNDLDQELLDSDEKYKISRSNDGFIIKLDDKKEVLGTIEVSKIALPEKLDQYLNLALIIAKASGLVISNIRRYQETLEAKKKQSELASSLKIINKILRHDIANNLNVEINAIDVYQMKKDEKFLKMAQNSAYRSVEVIRNMKSLENVAESEEDLLPYQVSDVIGNICKQYDVKTNISGHCLIMADGAFPSVVENLIRNAIVHGKADNIQISIEDDDGKCEITIADDGTGIPHEIKDQIFDEGFKYGETGNTGLGLFM